MKKIISLFIVVIMLSAINVFGEAYNITENTFERTKDQITVKYSGHGEEFMTLLVYDVTSLGENADANTVWESLETTPIKGIDQAVGTGSFVIPLDPDYSGTVVITLGGENKDCAKVMLKIENGIPTEITAIGYDAEGDSVALGNRTITIEKDGKLLNATVSTDTGKVEYTNSDGNVVTITGDISFDANGVVGAAEGSSAKLEITDKDPETNADLTTKTVGFIETKVVTSEDTSHTMTIKGTNGEKTLTSSHEFKFKALEGPVIFRVVEKNVPTAAALELVTAE